MAEALGFLYVDSGAVYRAVTWKALSAGVVGDGGALSMLVADMDLEFAVSAGRVGFLVDGSEPVDDALRTGEVTAAVSGVASMPAVRKRVVAWLQGLREFGDLVMEGRDIGTAVFPDADKKFYLDASPAERARRRGREEGRDEREVGDALRRRDEVDAGRSMDPLTVAPDATVIDSTGMTIDDVVAGLLVHVRQVWGK